MGKVISLRPREPHLTPPWLEVLRHEPLIRENGVVHLIEDDGEWTVAICWSPTGALQDRHRSYCECGGGELMARRLAFHIAQELGCRLLGPGLTAVRDPHLGSYGDAS